MSKILRDAKNTLEQLLTMHQLNLELLEQLDVSCHWILENKIQIPNEKNILSLLSKADILLKEIYSNQSEKTIRRVFTDKKNRRELDGAQNRNI